MTSPHLAVEAAARELAWAWMLGQDGDRSNIHDQATVDALWREYTPQARAAIIAYLKATREPTDALVNAAAVAMMQRWKLPYTLRDGKALILRKNKDGEQWHEVDVLGTTPALDARVLSAAMREAEIEMLEKT